MADYCKQCGEDLFGPGYHDMAGLCEAGFVAQVLCEGCGYTHVDHAGNCLRVDHYTPLNVHEVSLAKAREVPHRYALGGPHWKET